MDIKTVQNGRFRKMRKCLALSVAVTMMASSFGIMLTACSNTHTHADADKNYICDECGEKLEGYIENPGNSDEGNNNGGNNDGGNSDEGNNDGGNNDGENNQTAVTPANISLNKFGSFDTGIGMNADGGSAEIVKYNSDNDKFYLVSGNKAALDIVSVVAEGENGEIKTVFNEETDRIDFNKLVADNASKFAAGFEYGDITSVAINTELDVIAVAIQHKDYDKKGAVAVLDYDGKLVAVYECGVQPDCIAFEGNYILTADEGEPREGYGSTVVDPEGSVTVIDLSGGAANGKVKTADFKAFDAFRSQLVEQGIIIMKGANPSTDFEPEYIVTEGNTAYVALQEANAIAVIDIAGATVTGIYAMGFKNHSVEGNGLDMLEDGTATVETQSVYGVYMPDGMDILNRDGKVYLFTANEGDAREWGSGDNEFSGVAKYEVTSSHGDKSVTKVEVLDNSAWDGIDADKHYLLGGRSFSVLDMSKSIENAVSLGESSVKTGKIEMVYDSGDEIESLIASDEECKDYFNSSNDDIELDSRSKKKGPEPETVSVAEVDGNTYCFVGLERQGGMVAFDVTDLEKVDTLKHFTSRQYTADMAGDVAPENIIFIADNPSGKPMLAVANEVSGTLALYAIENESKTYEIHEETTFLPEEEVGGPDWAVSELVISHVYGGGGKGETPVSHSFIAITNNSDKAIALDGYKIRYSTMRDSTGERQWKELVLAGTLPAGASYVILGEAEADSKGIITFAEGEYNFVWEGLIIDNKQYSVELVDGTGNTIDAVGAAESAEVAETEQGEGELVTGISKQYIVWRKSAVDTNNNADDFAAIELKGLSQEDAAQYKPVAAKL